MHLKTCDNAMNCIKGYSFILKWGVVLSIFFDIYRVYRYGSCHNRIYSISLFTIDYYWLLWEEPIQNFEPKMLNTNPIWIENFIKSFDAKHCWYSGRSNIAWWDSTSVIQIVCGQISISVWMSEPYKCSRVFLTTQTTNKIDKISSIWVDQISSFWTNLRFQSTKYAISFYRINFTFFVFWYGFWSSKVKLKWTFSSVNSMESDLKRNF